MYATGLAAPQILVDRDPEAAEAVRQEVHRQQNSLVLIASENHASQAVLEASASVMTNKYAEGYPGRRYYAGCEFVDVAESLAIERLNRLFGSEHANVQSHSGTQANLAVYTALMQPGETLMGMRLDHGGHLSHGSPVNFTGKFYNIVSYGVRPRHRAHRLRAGRGPGEGAPPQVHRRRLQRLRPHRRLGPLPRRR